MEQGQVYPELANKPIGFLLQKTEEESRKTPGETAWTAKLVGVFESQTELTASEILSGKKTPEALAQRVALLADRPLKKRPAASHSSANAYAKASNGGGADFDDSDIPF
jgi:single-stranded DNA-binding protein